MLTPRARTETRVFAYSEREVPMKVARVVAVFSALPVCAMLALPAVAQHSAPKVKVTIAQAEAAALKKYHGKVEGKTKLENEGGKWQYAVNVRSGKTLHEVMVDAKTGKIASAEVTTKAEEAREAAAEAAHARRGHAVKPKK